MRCLRADTGKLVYKERLYDSRRGWPVRVLARHPASDKAQGVAALGATLVGDDLTGRGALAAAMPGVDVLGE